MRKLIPILLAAAALGIAGCNDSTSPRDVSPPAAPRGLFSVTGDGSVKLSWLANTEGDLAGYRVYEAGCASGSNCPYDRIGATQATQMVVGGLTNGTTRYFAVSAVDNDGNESPLSYEDVYDTPRPAGSTALTNFFSDPTTPARWVSDTTHTGWDFSAFAQVRLNDPSADVFYGNNGNIAQMFATWVQGQQPTEIQDAGYASSLDAVDYAPQAGWSPTGTVELIKDHNYIVWTWDDHYAKFRVTSNSYSTVSLDWAYQIAASNGELHARPVHTATNSPRRIVWLR
jgi:hypothetical protein